MATITKRSRRNGGPSWDAISRAGLPQSDVTRKLIADFRMLQSMRRKANCWDNSPMESFFKTLKVERATPVPNPRPGSARHR